METIEAPRGGYVLVRIPGDFGRGTRLYFGRCPVTNEEYLRYVLARDAPRPRYWPKDGFEEPREPVVGVSWCDAIAYCQWAGLELPTETRWEQACTERSAMSRDLGALDRVAWYAGNSGDRLQPVGGKQANRFGLHDMLGTVWEWCMDEVEVDKRDFTLDLLAAADDAPPATEIQRVLRGGSYRSTASVVVASRVTAYDPQCGPDIGFRPILIEREH